MTKTMIGRVLTTLAVTAVIAIPSDAQSQSLPGVERAAELEFEAAMLSGQRDQWAYVADLYLAAVQLREEQDPQAQEDLLIVANLSYQTGNVEGAIAALESAASRAFASGDVVRAARIFTDAAWVANKAGRRIDQRRLASRVTQLADSSDLTRAERRQILSRLTGA